MISNISLLANKRDLLRTGVLVKNPVKRVNVFVVFWLAFINVRYRLNDALYEHVLHIERQHVNFVSFQTVTQPSKPITDL